MKFKGLLLVLVAVGSVTLGEEIIKVGDPLSQVLATLGQPSRKFSAGVKSTYYYDAGFIVIKDGKIESISDEFKVTMQCKQIEKEATEKKRLENEAFAAGQKAKGLVLYNGWEWVTKEDAAQREQVDKEAARRQKEFADIQRARGLVLYDGLWVTPELKIRQEERARLVETAREQGRLAKDAEDRRLEEARRRFNIEADLKRKKIEEGDKSTLNLNIHHH